MVNYQPLDSFLEKRKRQGASSGYVFPEDTDLAIGGVRKLNAAMIVFDVEGSSQFSDDDFVNFISPFLHMAFHVVKDRKGVVDKYTGDGAMVSFCGKGVTDNDACTSAIEAALDISDVVYKLRTEYEFPPINIRIGVDFGPIQVERIGVRGKTQLIIVGTPATCSKRLETLGKQIEFDQNSTICIGYDIYYNLNEKRQGLSQELNPEDSELRKYFKNSSSFYTKKPPYTVYRYKGRYREK